MGGRPGDGRLGHRKSELEQFAMNARCSPKRVRNAHVANELANVRRCSLAGHHAVVISSANRLGTHHGASGSPSAAWEFSVRPIPQEPYGRAPQTPSSQRCRTPIAGNLRRSMLSWCRRTRISASNATRPQQFDQGAPDRLAQIAHRERVSADSQSRSAVLGLR